jgi:hypothetical protein
VATDRPTNSVGYERLAPALDRFMGTFVKTSIATGRKPETKAFSLIQSYDYSRKKHGIFERLQYLEVELSNWLFRGIEANEVLGISRDYFRLRRPIDRRQEKLTQGKLGARMSARKATVSKLEAGEPATQLRTLMDALAAPDLELVVQPRNKDAASRIEELF